MKPTKKETMIISERIADQHVKDMNGEDLLRELMNGRTVVPSYLGRKKNGEIRRLKECWKSQELLMIDFDNEFSDSSGNKFPNPIQFYIDDAVREFSKTALFMFTSFNHTEKLHKFRVVLQFDRMIASTQEIELIYEYFREKYKNTADLSSFETNRMFFGGKGFYQIFDFNNRIDTRMILTEMVERNRKHENDEKHDETEITSPTLFKNDQKNSPIVGDSQNINLIRNGNYEALRKIVGAPKNSIKFETISEINDYLVRQDLSLLLGTSHNLRCLYHDDKSASASIYKDDREEHENKWWYHCHSTGCNVTKNIFHIVEDIYGEGGKEKADISRFLCDVYNIEFITDEWKQRMINRYHSNIFEMTERKIDLDEMYPNVMKHTKENLELIKTFNTLASFHVTNKHTVDRLGNPVFYCYLNEILDRMGNGKNNIKNLSKQVAFLAYLGFINKLGKEDIPDKLYKKMNYKKAQLRRKQDVLFFSIPAYMSQIFELAEKRSIRFFNELKLSKGAISNRLFQRVFDPVEAYRVYPNMKYIEDRAKKTNDEYESILLTIVLTSIAEKQYALEREVIEEFCQWYTMNKLPANSTHTGKTYAERKAKEILKIIINNYALDRVLLTKELKVKYNCEHIDTRPYIIIEMGKEK